MTHSKTLRLSGQTARRFILGRQGLWPGRRWHGDAGLREALHAVGQLQLDPLNITARSQDLMLHARVSGYRPEQWQEPAYSERGFFDWGGWLALRPMSDLPDYRTLMQHEAEQPAFRRFAESHAELLAEMRELLKSEGPLMNRDFNMADRRRVEHYRGRKDSALALYHLWRTGEVMIHDRVRFERQYDLTERIAPAELLAPSPLPLALRRLLLSQVAFHGLRHAGNGYPLSGPRGAAETRKLLEELTREGLLVPVEVEGWRGVHYVLAGDVPLLRVLLEGGIPEAWKASGPTTADQVTFLAPLDPVSARGRALKVFGFDYVWEVYKPAARRRWGYYVLPILFGDSLVARADLRLDRASLTLEVTGFWLEDGETGRDGDFAVALGRGLAALRDFTGADSLDLQAIRPVRLRDGVRAAARGGSLTR